MSIFEYDEEKHMKSERKEWREIGREEGVNDLAQLLKTLMDAGKNDEIERVISDADYRKKLLRE